MSDFTAISHGVTISKSPWEQLYCIETYLSMTYVIFYMTYVLAANDRVILPSPLLIAMKDVATTYA